MKSALLAAALLAVSAQANALLVVSPSIYGPTSLVTDTQSGVTWLNLDLTRGRPYESIAADIQLMSNFRLATDFEIEQLFKNAGFFILYFSFLDPWPTAEQLVDPVRLAGNQAFKTAFNGYGQPPDGPEGFGGFTFWQPRNAWIFSGAQVSPNESFVETAIVGPVSQADIFETPPLSADLSFWLVATGPVPPAAPIPEPSTYLLLLVGLLAVAARRVHFGHVAR